MVLYYFLKTASGEIISETDLLSDVGSTLTAFAHGDPSQNLFSLGLSNGSAILLQHQYDISYPNDVRLIKPHLVYPLGKQPIAITETAKPIELISAQHDGEQTTIAAVVANKLYVVNLLKEESFLTDEIEITRTVSTAQLQGITTHLIVDVEQREIYTANDQGYISYYDISDKENPRLIQKVTAVAEGEQITSLSFLSGGISILVGDSEGKITQWFPVRDDDNNYTLQSIRHFTAQATDIVQIEPEYFRKGLVAIDKQGVLGLYHTTAHRVVKTEQISSSLMRAAISPRANALLLEDDNGQLQYWHVDNEHPEISWQSIWGKVWYESRQQPEHIWQSSSASSDFEPKFSLTPLAFGTLKAAFYAMLFAIPMAICGAIYTAYFMSPQMRGVVKPTIEIMEALPTVILWFSSRFMVCALR